MEIAREMGRIDLPSRISARAVVVASVLSIVLFGLLTSLGGALGLIPMGGMMANAETGHRAGKGFVLWEALASIAAVFIAGFVASVISRSTSRRDGLLHGLATWSFACLTLNALLCLGFMAAVRIGVAGAEMSGPLMMRGAFLAFFLGDTLTLLAGLAGGALGARSERRSAARPPIEARIVERGPVPRGSSPVPG